MNQYESCEYVNRRNDFRTHLAEKKAAHSNNAVDKIEIPQNERPVCGKTETGRESE